jgi:hypothetical protein
MERYLDDVQDAIGPFLNTRDFIVVGNSLRDDRIRRLVEQAGGAVWFIAPSDVPAELATLAGLRAVTGPDLTFEMVFPALADGLGVGVAGERLRARGPERAESAATTDDLIAAAVGLAAAPDGPPVMTGFVLADPRVIVTDGYAGNTGRFDPAAVTILTSSGRRLATRARHLVTTHPFGPWILEVPPELQTAGLRLGAEPLDPGETVHIAVAAGERVGLSTGKAVRAVEVELNIQPIGRVRDLVHIGAAVSPGASGAPVVDAGMRVRGFVVAGSSDPKHPDSYMYPARHWHAQLPAGAAAAAGAPKRKRKTSPTRTRRR